ncbi:hypothetical protein BGZ97_001503 [Linnemannia gamsii]|jgi:FMN phosphatase YigB (HAD superfamily)|uniref:HAD-like protein n=1 Tax=Linnemannia gamsii TaxID=64522 RepID=A0A9P6RJ20_9FUNG|nr:hypothetical protein BGZ97_001503 [Linnemannia gamsii]
MVQVNNTVKYPTKMPTAIFLDSGGVINDNRKRAPQWVRYLGEYLPTTVLGGNAQVWGMANVEMIGPFFRRWHEFMNEATLLAAQAKARAQARDRARTVDGSKEGREGEEEEEEREETNVYRIFERLNLLIWIKEMCQIASRHLPASDDLHKTLPTLTDNALFEIAKSAHVYAIQRVRADYPGAVDAIRSIKSMPGKMRLYTSSADSFEDLEMILGGLGVFEEFDAVYGADRVDCLKNSEQYYRRVFEAVGVRRVVSRKEDDGQQGVIKETEEDAGEDDVKYDDDADNNNEEEDEAVEVVVVDDSVRALKYARVHGARTVLITSLSEEDEEVDLSLEENRHVDYQLKALSDLPALLDSWRAHFSLAPFGLFA